MRHRIVIAGFGATGRCLAASLGDEWEVSAVDLEPDDAASTVDCGTTEADITKGDATSALVLARARLEGAHSAVACTASDEANLEFLRLAKERFGVPNLFVLLRDPAFEPGFAEIGARVVSRAESCARALSQRVPRSHAVPTGVGLGLGEVVEVEVLPGSSVVGRPLLELHPKSWLVAAVYRDGGIIVPHGDTLLEPGDRVLLAGEPDVLPSIASLIRGGESEFPLQHGTNIVMFCDLAWEEVARECAYLARHSKAKGIEIIACSAGEQTVEAVKTHCAALEAPCEVTRGADDGDAALVAEASRRDVGVLVLPDEPVGFLEGFGITRSRIARAVSLIDSPILISRGTFPYDRILLVVGDSCFSRAAVRVAVDAARVLHAALHIAVVHESELVVGVEAHKEVEERAAEAEELASVYRLRVERRILYGNPVRAIVPLSSRYDLVVLPYHARRRAFARPNAEARLVHRCRCSVMIVPS